MKKLIISRIFLIGSLSLLAACGFPSRPTPPPAIKTPTLTATLTETVTATLAGSPKKTDSGFYWPTGSDTLLNRYPMGAWLTDGCPDPNHHSKVAYFGDQIHTGWDIAAGFGDPVYLIADGRIAAIDDSSGDWGSTEINNVQIKNIAMVVEHVAVEDNTHFYAIYGHIQPIGKLKVNTFIHADGKPFATIGHWDLGNHLHFGIRDSQEAPLHNLGTLDCKTYGAKFFGGDTNQYVNPIDWILNHHPAPFTAQAPSDTLTLTPTSTLHTVTPTVTRTFTPTPTPAPGGNWIAYVGPDENVWLIHPDGSGLTQLTQDGKAGKGAWDPVIGYRNLAWSPDGSLLGMLRIEAGGKRIQALRLSDLSVIPLASNVEGSFDWLPDGRAIVYSTVPYEPQSTLGDQAGGLALLEVSSGKVTPFIDSGAGLRLTQPHSARLGGNVFFSIDVAPRPMGMHAAWLGLAKSSGGTYVEITNNNDCAWSPDGERLACRAGIGEIFCSNIVLFSNAGKKLADIPKLSGCNAQMFNPVWSPDGKLIAFSGKVSNNTGVYSLHPDGSGLTQLATSTSIVASPEWSPKGQSLAILSGKAGSMAVYVMNADGSQLKQLTKTSGDVRAFTWQPGSRAITGGVVTATPVPTPGGKPDAIDLTDPQSIVYWFAYGLKNVKISPFEQMISDESIMYGTGLAGQRDGVQRNVFLKWLADRLPSQPACMGYDVSADKKLIIVWTKGWQPLWDFRGTPTSDELTFSFYAADGKFSLATAYFTPSSAILGSPNVKSQPCP